MLREQVVLGDQACPNPILQPTGWRRQLSLDRKFQPSHSVKARRMNSGVAREAR